jgi:hypothetical protein
VTEDPRVGGSIPPLATIPLPNPHLFLLSDNLRHIAARLSVTSGPMTARQTVRAFFVVLLALQAIVIAPIAMALAPHSTATSTADCDMGTGGSHEDCPGCPPDGSMQDNCAAICIGVTAPAPTMATLSWAPTDRGYLVSESPLLPSRVYSPVNPPPIG